MRTEVHRVPRAAAVGLVLLVVVAMAGIALAPLMAGASSHREAPLVSADPQVDGTDLYAFVSPDDPSKVTIVSNWIPFEEPAGGPNFYSFAPGVRYDIKISNDGDAAAEIIYRWMFHNHYRNPNTFLYNTGPVTSLDDPDLNFYQTYDLRKIVVGRSNTMLVNEATVAPSDVGAASMPSFDSLSDEAITTLPNNGKTWAGQADDPFFLDLRVFDLLYGGNFGEAGDDTLEGFNVHSFAIQVPKGQIAKGRNASDNPVVGIWTTAARRSTTVIRPDGTTTSRGDWVQISRLGMPLVNEVVVPVSLKNYFNGSSPTNDEQYLGAVNNPELPRLIEAVYSIPAPDSNPTKDGIQRSDLVSVFLKGVDGLNRPANVEAAEMLRLNMSIAPCPAGCPAHSTLGVIGGDTAGFPNGRRLEDDIIDISLQVVEGELIGTPNDLADGVGANDLPFEMTFPYLAYPHRGSDDAPH
jgi:Domain of unknown function (DUF4331)